MRRERFLEELSCSLFACGTGVVPLAPGGREQVFCEDLQHFWSQSLLFMQCFARSVVCRLSGLCPGGKNNLRTGYRKQKWKEIQESPGNAQELDWFRPAGQEGNCVFRLFYKHGCEIPFFGNVFPNVDLGAAEQPPHGFPNHLQVSC